MNTLTEQLKWIVLAIFVVITGVIWYAVFTESRDGILTVAFLDVGQGDAVLSLVTQRGL